MQNIKPIQTWIWTALPNGVRRDRHGGPYLKVSLVVSPRLHVERLTDEWRRWPLTAENVLRFSATFAAGGAEPVTVGPNFREWSETSPDDGARLLRDRSLEEADDRFGIGEAARAWRVMFNRNVLEGVRGGVPVRPVELAGAVRCELPQLEPKAVRQGDAAREVRERYAGRAVGCDLPPRPAAVVCELPPDVGDEPATAIGQTARLATERLEPVETVKIGIGKTAEQVSKFDFHERVAALADYPALLKMFRIVVDVLVPWRAEGTDDRGGRRPPAVRDGPLDGWLWPAVRTRGALAPGTRQAPVRTACRIVMEGGRPVDFVAREDPAGRRPYGPTLANAAGSRFKVQAVDAVSAAIKIRGMDASAAGTSDELPALRTAGLTVLIDRATDDVRGALDRQVDLDAKLDDAFAKGKYLPAVTVDQEVPPFVPDVPVWLDHVVVGHRISAARRRAGAAAFDAPRSLCARSGRYAFADAKRRPIEGLEDEGIVSDAHARRGAAGAVVVNDAMATWSGWGLCVARPGYQQDLSRRVLDQHNRLANTERLPLDVAFAAPRGALPALRFGDAYRLRVEPVDLAGHTMAVPSSGATCDCGCGRAASHCARGDVTFRRCEPVPGPLVLGGTSRAAAESAREMVVHSAQPGTADQPLPGFVVALDGREPVRWVFPPPAPFRLAELHGAFDGWRAAAVYEALRARRSTPVDWAPTIGRKPPVDDRGQTIKGPRFDDRLTYLPDPMASRVVATLLLEDGKSVLAQPVPGERRVMSFLAHPFDDARDARRDVWQRWLPFKIRLVRWDQPGNAAGARFAPDEPDGRTLTVQLAPGRTARLRLRCLPPKPVVRELFEAATWFPDRKAAADADDPSAGGDLLADDDSLTDLVAPPIHVTLTHAVRRPGPAVVDVVVAPRQAGNLGLSTSAVPRRLGDQQVAGAVPLTVDTETVEVVAEVRQRVDDLSMNWTTRAPEPPGPRGGAKPEGGGVGMGPPVVWLQQRARLTGLTQASAVPIALPSAGAYYVTLRAESASRYRELFIDRSKLEQAEAKFDATAGGRVHVRQQSGPGRPASAVATDETGEASHGFWADNTKPPPAPEVAYVVPIVPDVAVGPTPPDSRRLGFRVYLRRPWFVSGEDERLAVILRPKPVGDSPAAREVYRNVLEQRLRGLVTEWGGDPIRETLLGPDAPPPPKGGLTPSVDDIGGVGPEELRGPFVPLELRKDVKPLPPVIPVPPAAGRCDLPRPPSAVRCELPPRPPVVRCDLPDSAMGGRPATAPLLCDVERATFVDVVTFPVRQCEVTHGGERLCYADVAFRIPAGDERYFPFVRLALARFQPHSVGPAELPHARAHLSTIVQAEFMLLPAGRTLEARRAVVGGEPVVRVVLAGAGVDEASRTRDAAGRGVLSSWAHVAIERRADAADGTEAWVPTGLDGGRFYDPAAKRYEIIVGLAGATERIASVPIRAVVREYERYQNAAHEAQPRPVLVASIVVGP